VALIATLIVIFAKGLFKVAIAYFQAKQKWVIDKIDVNTYNQTLAFARDIWLIIEEHFRISDKIGKVTDEKIAMFSELLKQKVPGITQENIDYFRQTIAGEFNAFKDKITEPIATTPASTPTTGTSANVVVIRPKVVQTVEEDDTI
jgi:hypothetical protein